MGEYLGMYSVTIKTFEEMKADRDRWRGIAEAMADCLDSSTDAMLVLQAYEQAARDESTN